MLDISKRPAIFLFQAGYNGRRDPRNKFTWGLTPDDAIARARKAEEAAMKMRNVHVSKLAIYLLPHTPYTLEAEIIQHAEMLEYRAALAKWRTGNGVNTTPVTAQ